MKKKDLASIKINLIGHPFSPSGRGEDIRCAARSLDKIGLDYSIIDIYGKKGSFEEEYFNEFNHKCIKNWDSDINLFILNGDEVQPVLSFLNIGIPKRAYNIIYPQWELELYPNEWAIQLDRFDEIWAPSRFVEEALLQQVNKPITYVPLAVEIKLKSFLPRVYFQLPESSYLFLFFFDFNSYIERKNPRAILKTVTEVFSRHRFEDIRLVLKTIKPNESDRNIEKYNELRNHIDNSSIRDRVIFLDYKMTDTEIKNLIRCCDCFVSLHRSEGFGRGLAEAMALGKPVIGTNYSGNLDFMSHDNSFLVDYQLINVKEGEYPHYQGQKWAEINIEHSTRLMSDLLLDRDKGRSIGIKAQNYISTLFNYRATGLHYLNRISQIRTKFL